MDLLPINERLLAALHEKAKAHERKRTNFDLRTTPADNSQRMLNVLEPGTVVPIHRHMNTSETVLCLEGRLDWIIYEEDVQPGRGPVADDIEIAPEGHRFREVARYRLCPREGNFGTQTPKGTWHSIEVYEQSTIFEGKDGAYRKP